MMGTKFIAAFALIALIFAQAADIHFAPSSVDKIRQAGHGILDRTVQLNSHEASQMRIDGAYKSPDGRTMYVTGIDHLTNTITYHY